MPFVFLLLKEMWYPALQDCLSPKKHSTMELKGGSVKLICRLFEQKQAFPSHSYVRWGKR